METISAKGKTKRIFRTRPLHWGFWIVVLLLVPAFVASVVYLVPEVHPMAQTVLWFFLIMWAAITAFALDTQLMPMWRTYMILDNHGLAGRADQQFYEIYWVEIIAANLFQDKQAHPMLWLATRKYELPIPLKYLDAKRIWQFVQDRLNPDIIGSVAYHKWLEQAGYFRELAQANTELIGSVRVPLRTRRKTGTIVLGWFGLLFLSSCSILVGLCGSSPIVFLLAILPTIGMGLLAFPSTIEMDPEKVTRITPLFGRYQIRWDEIRKIEHSPGFEWLVFYGDNKHLPMTGPSGWATRSGQQVQAFLRAQVQQREIEVRSNPGASLVIFPKNTRVK
jgi:hypothetical protein